MTLCWIKKCRRIIARVATAAGLSALAATGAVADPIADFYADKRLTLVVSTAPGGGFDLYARTLAMHMGRHIPGRPPIILQFMPGAGGVTAADYLYSIAARDGTVFGLPNQSVALYQKLKTGVRYDAARFNWIGRMVSADGVLVLWHGGPATTLAQMKTTEVVFGASGKGQDTYFFPRMMATLLGYKVKTVPGYPSASDVMTAMERGEAHGYTSNWAALLSTRGDWLTQGKLIPIANASLERRKDYPDVPLLAELTDDPSKKAIIEFFSSIATVGRSFTLPPGVPPERVAALRRAFTETMADPAFRADAQKRMMELEPMTGEAIQSAIEKVVSTPSALIAAAIAATD